MPNLGWEPLSWPTFNNHCRIIVEALWEQQHGLVWILFYCPKMWRPRIYVFLCVSLCGFVSWTSQTNMKSKELLIYSAPLFTLIGSYYLFFFERVWAFFICTLSTTSEIPCDGLACKTRSSGPYKACEDLPHEPSASNIFQPYESHAHHTFHTFLLSHHGILLDLQPSPMWA